jgi:1,4-alpha-glucan branching enzyme
MLTAGLDPGLDPGEIAALLRGEHGDPFAVLGPHPAVGPSGAAAVWLRVLRPGALGVTAVDADGRAVASLARIEPPEPAGEPGGEAGLFAALITSPEPGADPALPPDYRLLVDYPHGHRELVDDPYRFGPGLPELDRYLLGEGTHLRPWTVLGAHPQIRDGVAGVRFAVWAPNAAVVAVIGDFNGWNHIHHPMRLHPGIGVWELFIPGIAPGAVYKYAIRAPLGPAGDPMLAEPPPLGQLGWLDNPGWLSKADPYAFAAELRPRTASVVTRLPAPAPAPELARRARARAAANDPTAPISIYEVHLGSWRRTEDGGFYDWARLAAELPAYVAELGFTHVELLPIAEHPFDGSWGYQVTGYYAPTARFGPSVGEQQGLAALVRACHAQGLAVLLDWVPAHFPDDPHALREFDGTALYEYADPREGRHEDWDTLIFNFGRTEVRNFLAGNALYWLDVWGLDGLRVDAVASMLYRDYSRPADAWLPNAQGGRENLEAVSLLRHINAMLAAEPSSAGAAIVAEESTSWAGVTAPLESFSSGPEVPLGFAYKWNLGWMHDTLAYMAEDPLHRKHHHDRLTFGLVYGFSERFVLPLSHDEVVHEKRSLLGRMPGDRWQRFANLRAYYGFMWAHPGKKLLFMGGELAQEREWDHDRALDWHLLDGPPELNEHRGIRALIRELNRVYRGYPALHARDCDPAGFEWLVVDDRERSVIAFLRKGTRDSEQVLVVCNFTPVPRDDYRIGLPDACPGAWVRILDTDARQFGGSDFLAHAGATSERPQAETIPVNDHPRSLSLTLPPLATIMLAPR